MVTDKDISKNEQSLISAASVLQLIDSPKSYLKIDLKTLNSPIVSKSIKKFGFYEIEIYKAPQKSLYGSCNEPCDSVIIFSRCGNPFWGYCEEVIIDYSINGKTYTGFSKEKGQEFYKVANRIYYKRYPTPIM